MKKPTEKHSLKRNGDASYENFNKAGYLKDAVPTTSRSLCWRLMAEQIFTLEQMIESFDVRASRSPPPTSTR
jgi:glutamyl/glutaminyl-tRNA synthetase